MLSTPIRQQIARVLMFAGVAPAAFLVAQAQTHDKVPITTPSAEARDLYLKGRDLAEKLRATDARRFYEQAVQKDTTFALGFVGLANTSGTTKEFIDAVTRAAALAASASPGEQHIIRGLRVAVVKNDLATAKAKSAEYARQVAPKQRPFEVRQQHELAGMIALAEKDSSTAVNELQAANQQDPRILYFLALASKGAGDSGRAATFATKAANFNGLNFTYGYVRAKARKLSAT